MALTRGFQATRTMGLTMIPLITVLEGGSTQTFKKGAVLVASSGYAVVGAADPSAETIIGVAAQDASGTQGTEIKVVPALPWVIFEGQIQNAAADATLVIATHMLAQFSINLTTTKFWIDTDDNTHTIVTIIGFKDAVGTLNGVVEFVFNPLGTIFGSNIT